jgi:ribosomal protein S18 acetylase RimI-like enzyme
MDFLCLHDKKEIERYLNKDVFLHIYSIGDLDNFFWPYTIWYGLRSNSNICAIALLYVGMPIPTLLAISKEHDVMEELLIAIRHLLPVQFYAHLSPGLEIALETTHDFTSHGEHYKMALVDYRPVSVIDCSDVQRLCKKDLTAIQVLYQESYPGNWFDPRMLETNKYYGIWEEERLVSIAGIHVYSPQYLVAALGNIATLPTHRKKGKGKRVTARLCQSLTNEGIRIGLNVSTENNAAISCYKKLGFKTVASYGEFLFQKKEK